MKVNVIGKNVAITEGMKEAITAKLKKLEKYSFINENDTAKVLIKTHKASQKVEITIPTKLAVLRAEVRDENAYPAVDKAVDKISDQIRRQKTKLEKKKKMALGISEAFAEKEEPEQVLRTKNIVLQPMDADEAIMQMELVGHDFFAFLDEETKNVSIVYKRNDGEYGLIETE